MGFDFFGAGSGRSTDLTEASLASLSSNHGRKTKGHQHRSSFGIFNSLQTKVKVCPCSRGGYVSWPSRYAREFTEQFCVVHVRVRELDMDVLVDRRHRQTLRMLFFNTTVLACTHLCGC